MAVLLCSGQGAQKVGMGVDLLAVPEVAQTFTLASEVLGVDLRALSESGTEDEINNAFNAQALTAAVSVGVGQALMQRGLNVDAVVGFSLGEVSALALTGVLSVEDTFAFLRVRARAIEEASQAQPGAMLALLGVDEAQARALCESCSQGDVLVPANFNCPGQIVVSGTVAAIDRAQQACAEQKIRASRLKTAGAFHSPLMEQAKQTIYAYLQDVTFSQPHISLICNTDAKPFDAAEACNRLSNQVVSPVLFSQSVQALISQGHTTFVEAGFGGVLFNLMKRINKEATRYKAGTQADFAATCEALGLSA